MDTFSYSFFMQCSAWDTNSWKVSGTDWLVFAKDTLCGDKLQNFRIFASGRHLAALSSASLNNFDQQICIQNHQYGKQLWMSHIIIIIIIIIIIMYNVNNLEKIHHILNVS